MIFWTRWNPFGGSSVKKTYVGSGPVTRLLTHLRPEEEVMKKISEDVIARLDDFQAWRSKQFQTEGLIAEAYGEGLHGAHVTLFEMDAAIEDLPR
jgi:hypothetical protein